MKKLLTVILVLALAHKSAYQLNGHGSYLSTPKDTIYVVSHGWHTGIVIANKDLSPDLAFIKKQLGNFAYYEFGWGDKGFYQADKITAKIALNAIFRPTPSVMHVVGLSNAPHQVFLHSETIELNISKQGLAALNEKLVSSFQYEKGNAQATRTGLYGKSLFFTGQGRYYLTNTCNTWTAEVLETAGLPVEATLTLTASSVMWQAQQAADLITQTTGNKKAQ